MAFYRYALNGHMRASCVLPSDTQLQRHDLRRSRVYGQAVTARIFRFCECDPVEGGIPENPCC
jgi:hypothetical protein